VRRGNGLGAPVHLTAYAAVAESIGQLEFASILEETAAILRERRVHARVETFWRTSGLVKDLGWMAEGSAERIANEATMTQSG
jgi:hypothetical protein